MPPLFLGPLKAVEELLKEPETRALHVLVGLAALRKPNLDSEGKLDGSDGKNVLAG